jgi:acyl-coenzyme A synthetase/AMP-(fatty) acid ligase
MPKDRAAGTVMNYTSGTTGKPKGVKRALAPKEIEPDLIMQMMSAIWQMFGIKPEDGNVHCAARRSTTPPCSCTRATRCTSATASC